MRLGAHVVVNVRCVWFGKAREISQVKGNISGQSRQKMFSFRLRDNDKLALIIELTGATQNKSNKNHTLPPKSRE